MRWLLIVSDHAVHHDVSAVCCELSVHPVSNSNVADGTLCFAFALQASPFCVARLSCPDYTALPVLCSDTSRLPLTAFQPEPYLKLLVTACLFLSFVACGCLQLTCLQSNDDKLGPSTAAQIWLIYPSLNV